MNHHVQSKPKVIVITGASSGIGAALALEYAQLDVVLGICGRNEERLHEVRRLCEARGAVVHAEVVDVTDKHRMRAWLEDIDRRHEVDILIANAGISGGTGKGGDMADITRKIFATNVDGVINTVMPLVPAMMARKRGQIAIISSLAGIRGLPSAPAYSASKAAVRFWGEGLRGSLGKHGIKVNVICPGYVKTPLTAVNTFPMPFIKKAWKAAIIIRKGLERNTPRIVFPYALYIPLWFLSCLSPRITDGFFARLPEK
ncbi:MAG: SDR family NAD(P)-dependent oxidoreductase [Alphaproteobacteria bacterium]|nr:SDR family NAD(P)-dependent oxidoreductase [Alphaproteobacteria bacterium]